MKLTVLYDSRSGNTKKMAMYIAEGMRRVDGAEASCWPIDTPDMGFLKESRCVVLGTPTYLASMSGTMKVWLEGPARKCGLAGKIGGAFATADYLHGGGDLAVQEILKHLMVLGMLVFSGGGSYGKPVIHLGPVALKEHLEESAPTFRLYGERMAKKAIELFSV